MMGLDIAHSAKVLLAVMAVVFLVGLAYVLDVELVLALLGSQSRGLDDVTTAMIL